MNVDPLTKQEENRMKTSNALHWIAFKFFFIFLETNYYFYFFI